MEKREVIIRNEFGVFRNKMSLELPIQRADMLRFDREMYFCMNDRVSFEGKITFYDYFGDYWLVDVTSINVMERRGQKPVVSYT